jgi:hypothetical protein
MVKTLVANGDYPEDDDIHRTIVNFQMAGAMAMNSWTRVEAYVSSIPLGETGTLSNGQTITVSYTYRTNIA